MRIPVPFVAVLTLAAVLIAGCPTPPDGNPVIVTGTIAGVVRDGVSDAPINGASISTQPSVPGTASAGDGTFTISNVPVGVYTIVVKATGYAKQKVAGVSVTAGQSASVNIDLLVPPATTGSATGSVLKHNAPSDTALPGATVALVDAEALEASGSKTPLETLAAASPYTAVTDGTGAYLIEGVTPGRYFVHAYPSLADQATVLPGGDTSRTSFEVEAGDVAVVDVVLSQQPSPSAAYVGSATCLICHNGTVATDVSDFKKTLHALVYRAPDQTSSIQDLSDYPNANAAHAYFKDGNSRDNTGAGDEYGLRITVAAFPKFALSTPANNYDIWLGYESGTSKYFMQFSNQAGTNVSEKYYVEFTFGGHGIYKERWITRVLANGSYDANAAGGDSSYYILPVQYDEALQQGAEPFHPYNNGFWGAPAVNGGPAVTPAKNKSFDLNCAGCHFTGNTLARDAGGLYHADALNPLAGGGIIDYDGDGVKDEMVIGCESCHGPGSEHMAASGAPKIVLSRYLSAERDAMLCGRCHTRGAGKGAFTGTSDHPEYPSKGTDAIEFPAPGVGYAEFVSSYHTDNPGVYADKLGHSRQHHQQFPDLQKSGHYKNQYQLVGCSECHELHNRDIGPSLSMSSDDNGICMTCHSPYTFGLPEGYSFEDEAQAVAAHMNEYAGMVAGYDPENTAGFASDFAAGGSGQCATCHMPKTAASQSRFVKEQVDGDKQPAGGMVRGDISSHIFDVITPAESQALYITATTNKQLPNSCGSCHNSVSDDLDYAYKSLVK